MKIFESKSRLGLLFSLESGLILFLITYLPDQFFNWFSILGYKWLIVFILLLTLALFHIFIYYHHKIKTISILIDPFTQKQFSISTQNKGNKLVISFVAHKSYWETELFNNKESTLLHIELLITNLDNKENSLVSARLKKHNIAGNILLKLQNSHRWERDIALLPEKTYDCQVRLRYFDKFPKLDKHLSVDLIIQDKFSNEYILKNMLFDSQHRRQRE